MKSVVRPPAQSIELEIEEALSADSWPVEYACGFAFQPADEAGGRIRMKHRRQPRYEEDFD